MANCLPVLLAATFLGCSGPSEAAGDDLHTGLTVSGPDAAVEKVLEQASQTPHTWVIEKRWKPEDGKTAVRLRWKERPNFRDVGGIVFLVQAGSDNGLTISDTRIVETSAPVKRVP